MTKFKRTLYILKNWRLSVSLLVGVVLLFNGSVLAAFGFILIFNYFDLIGYGGIMSRIKTKDLDLYFDLLQYYRIMQFIFEVTLLILIAYFYGIVVIYAIILHLFGVQDVFYYIIGGYKFPKKWTWMSWTPVGWFYKEVNNVIILIQALIGILIVISMGIL